MFDTFKTNAQRLGRVIKEGHINLKGDLYFGKYKDQNELPEWGYLPFASDTQEGAYIYGYSPRSEVPLNSDIRPLSREDALKGLQHKKNHSVLDDTISKVYGEAFYENGNLGLNVTDNRSLFVNRTSDNQLVCRSNEAPPQKMGQLRKHFYGQPDSNEGTQYGYEHFADKGNTSDVPVYGYYPYDCLESEGHTVPLSTRAEALERHLERSRDKQRNYQVGDSIYKVFGKTTQGWDNHLVKIEHATPVYLNPSAKGYELRSEQLDIEPVQKTKVAALPSEPTNSPPPLEVTPPKQSAIPSMDEQSLEHAKNSIRSDVEQENRIDLQEGKTITLTSQQDTKQNEYAKGVDVELGM